MSQDVLKLLRQDHQAAEALLSRFDTTTPADREGYFCELVQTLVGHEVAEEMVVYPAIRKDAPRGDEVVDDRLAEQAHAEETLAAMENLDPKSAAFTDNFTAIRAAVLTHAQAEEKTAFPLLEQSTGSKQRQQLGARYEQVKENAPTHPHPHAPDTAPANQILGPIAAIYDRARDAARDAIR